MIFKPARAQAEPIPQMKIVCDFDALVGEKIGFKFKNKYYLINNVSVENYMQITLAYRNLLEMVTSRSQGDTLPQNEVYHKYYDLIHPLVPDFEFEDLKSLPFFLLNQLIQLVMRQLAGDPGLYDKDEKKNPLIPPLKSP